MQNSQVKGNFSNADLGRTKTSPKHCPTSFISMLSIKNCDNQYDAECEKNDNNQIF